MDASTTIYGQCRCCLVTGSHRHLMKEYCNNGVKEVYFNIILDCFNIFLSSNTGLSTLICTSCVQCLRSAHNFKSMVMNAEQQLLAGLNDSSETVFISIPVSNLTANVKEEIQTEIKTETDVEHHNDDSDALGSDCLPGSEYETIQASQQHVVEGELEFLARFDSGTLPSLPTRKSLYDNCPLYVKHLDSLKGKKVTSKTIKKYISIYRKPKKCIVEETVAEKTAYFTNLNNLLKYTNLTPFKTRIKSGFPCYYCRDIFDDINLLRDHKKDHSEARLRCHIGTYGVENLVVYAEVTDLKCILCDKNVPTLSEIKEHLTEIHDKKIYKNVSDRIIPFTFNKDYYECQICNTYFENFVLMEKHMSMHFRNYICEQCGAAFITKRRIRHHIHMSHGIKELGDFPCNLCKKVFNTRSKCKSHINSVHKMVKRNKCPMCPERFTDYFYVQKHLVEVHGEEKKFQCSMCDRSFFKRYMLSLHMKRVHMNDKNVQCEVCSYSCYTNAELRAHMIKHSSEKKFECSICKKSYARKKTLREHMKIHMNIRKFCCSFCGQAFVQNTSLKSHVKTHHS